MISVVAETLDMHPQTLRKYERAGFVEPLRMGTLRTYSDEDVARLRLIKHFVDDLGLNLSGVEMALETTNDLLELRMRLSADNGSSEAVAESIKQVDKMLANLGVRMVRRPQADGQPQTPAAVEAWFEVSPGAAVEFREVAGEGPWGSWGQLRSE